LNICSNLTLNSHTCIINASASKGPPGLGNKYNYCIKTQSNYNSCPQYVSKDLSNSDGTDLSIDPGAGKSQPTEIISLISVNNDLQQTKESVQAAIAEIKALMAAIPDPSTVEGKLLYLEYKILEFDFRLIETETAIESILLRITDCCPY
jgi:hypothetical protein